ncbi:hypothetical protein FEM03_22390 [Phragmitibacter flavus]|uniref:PEP-CTERM sorting domain-containing protein n=2 Tax=Phragmitibacter flavus TaxID=2576071 RepID=A0A5R8K7Z0_9BACT|nr:hypothetical protein FEM03_22390 [Phragmitibacter flavus]
MRRVVLFLMVSILSWGFEGVRAATVLKADNGDDLELGSSWVGGVAPGIADVATWDGTVTGASTVELDVSLGTVTWGGMQVVDPAGLVTIQLKTGLNFGDASGNLGIDMSAATQDMVIESATSQVINWTTAQLNVNIASGRTLTVNTKFGASDTFRKQGEGTLILMGSNDNGGTQGIVDAGVLVLAKASTSGFHALGGGTHVVNGGVMKMGGTGGDQIYFGANVSLNGGMIDFDGRSEGWNLLNGGAAGTVTNSGATGSVMTLGEGTGNGAFSGVIEDGVGGLALVKKGTGTMGWLGTTNTYAGGTRVEGGVLQMVDDGSLGAAASGVTLLNGGTLMNSATSPAEVVMGRTIDLELGEGAFRAGWGKRIRLDGLVTGAGGLRVRNDSGDVMLMNAANDFAGATLIGGTGGSGTSARLTLGVDGALPDGTDLFFDAGVVGTGVLNLNGRTQTVNSLSTLSGLGRVESVLPGTSTQANGANLIVAGDETTVFTGTMGNSIRLTHSGTGQLSLEGTGDNSGLQATVNAGTLVLAKTSTVSHHALGGGSHVVNSGGTMRFGGTGGDQIYFGSTVTVNTGGVLDFNGRDESWNVLQGSGLVTNTAAGTASVMTLGESSTSGSVAFAGQVNDGAGSMAVRKIGLSALMMNGVSDYSGGTTVESGMLGGVGVWGTGPLVVRSGATWSRGSNAGGTFLGAGTLDGGGAVTLEVGAIMAVNVAFGGNAAQTDLVRMSGAMNLGGAVLDVAWGGNASHEFAGTYSDQNMFWLTDGASAVVGEFANFSAVGDWGLFGGVEYATATFGGQEFALFYGSQYEVYGAGGLVGGSDLLVMAVPEPGRAVMVVVGLGWLLGVRRRWV